MPPDVMGKKLFQFLKDNYEIPDENQITGFTVTVSIDDVMRITWHTIAKPRKDNAAGPRS